MFCYHAAAVPAKYSFHPKCMQLFARIAVMEIKIKSNQITFTNKCETLIHCQYEGIDIIMIYAVFYYLKDLSVFCL